MCTVVYTGWPDMMRRLVVTGGHSSLLTHSQTNIQHSVSIPSMPSSNTTPHQNTQLYLIAISTGTFFLLTHCYWGLTYRYKNSLRSYDYRNENICVLNVNIIFCSILKVHFRKLHDHISLWVSCLYIHNALLLISFFKRSVFLI